MTVSKRLKFEILRRDNHTCRYCGGAVPDVVLTIDHVLPVGLDLTDLLDFIPIAMQKPGVILEDRWRYFCGICWRAISDLDERAAELIAGPDEDDPEDLAQFLEQVDIYWQPWRRWTPMLSLYGWEHPDAA